jgi:hypothetical protein
LSENYKERKELIVTNLYNYQLEKETKRIRKEKITWVLLRNRCFGVKDVV